MSDPVIRRLRQRYLRDSSEPVPEALKALLDDLSEDDPNEGDG